MNKVSKRVKLYILNHETQVPELMAVERAAFVSGLSIEDFMRGAVMQGAARVLREYADLMAKEMENTDGLSEETSSSKTAEAGTQEGETTIE